MPLQTFGRRSSSTLVCVIHTGASPCSSGAMPQRTSGKTLRARCPRRPTRCFGGNCSVLGAGGGGVAAVGDRPRTAMLVGRGGEPLGWSPASVENISSDPHAHYNPLQKLAAPTGPVKCNVTGNGILWICASGARRTASWFVARTCALSPQIDNPPPAQVCRGPGSVIVMALMLQTYRCAEFL